MKISTKFAFLSFIPNFFSSILYLYLSAVFDYNFPFLYVIPAMILTFLAASVLIKILSLPLDTAYEEFHITQTLSTKTKKKFKETHYKLSTQVPAMVILFIAFSVYIINVLTGKNWFYIFNLKFLIEFLHIVGIFSLSFLTQAALFNFYIIKLRVSFNITDLYFDKPVVFKTVLLFLCTNFIVAIGATLIYYSENIASEIIASENYYKNYRAFYHAKDFDTKKEYLEKMVKSKIKLYSENLEVQKNYFELIKNSTEENFDISQFQMQNSRYLFFDPLYTKTNQIINKHRFLFFIFLILICSYSYFTISIIAKSIKSQISSLNKNILDVIKVKTKIKPLIISSHSEFGVLTDNFNKLLLYLQDKNDNITELYEELESLNQHLEDKIDKRTVELQNKNIELLVLNKEKERLIADISHELRTPLNGIKGLAQLLKISDNSNKNKNYIDNIIKSSTHLSNLINMLLNNYTNDHKLEQFNIEDVLNYLKYIFIKEIKEKNIFLFTYISKDVPKLLYGHINSFKQILINLIGNAVKFTNQGGIKVIITSINKSDENVTLKITVQDTGIGIHKNNLDKIFNEFFREEDLKKKYEGAGLGLAITKKLVENHSGNIHVNSEQGTGTTFTITLNYNYFEKNSSKYKLSVKEEFILLSDIKILNDYFKDIFSDLDLSYMIFTNIEDFIELKSEFDKNVKYIITDNFLNFKSEITEFDKLLKENITIIKTGNNINEYQNTLDIYTLSSAEIFNIIKGKNSMNIKQNNLIVPLYDKIRVLIVEDNHVNMKVICDLMKLMNAATYEVNNAEDALEILKEKEFDLVFLDIQLNGMNGLELGTIINKNYSCKLVALTASATSNIKEAAFNSGFDEFLKKPFNFEDIFNIFDKYFPKNKISDFKTKNLNQKKYIKLLIDSLEEDLTEISDLIKNKNFNELRKKIHLRKGGALQINLTKLSLILEKMETASIDENITIITKLYRELISEINYLKEGE